MEKARAVHKGSVKSVTVGHKRNQKIDISFCGLSRES